MKKFSKQHIEKLLREASSIAPELVEEIYDALNNGGVEAVNTLFRTKGTFNPKFPDKKSVIEYLIIMKQFSAMGLTPKEEAISYMAKNKN